MLGPAALSECSSPQFSTQPAPSLGSHTPHCSIKSSASCHNSASEQILLGQQLPKAHSLQSWRRGRPRDVSRDESSIPQSHAAAPQHSLDRDLGVETNTRSPVPPQGATKLLFGAVAVITSPGSGTTPCCGPIVYGDHILPQAALS